MIARIKGLKISQASERTAVTGQEMIPFQDGERNGKIRMIEFKDMTMYIFDPTIVDGKVSQEDYDALKQAIEEGKLIYTINSNRNGLDLATEVAIVGGTIYIESPDFIKEEGTNNISQVVFDTITVDGSLNYSKEQYTTTVIKTTGDGTKVLTDNGQYVYIGNLALTNIKFKDGTNTSTYDLVTNGITFRQNSTPCVSWNTVKSGNNIYMDIRIANATASMDGLMSKEDYVELNTTIPGQIEDLKESDSNLNNRIDDLDDKIDKEIADREAEIDRIENKFDGVTDELEAVLQKEIEDRKAGDTTITNSLNAFISTKGQPGGLAELDSTGKVPAAQLPSYVDDVLEFSTKAQFPQTGETGKIYVAKDTNLTYRWTGTQYLEISQSLALGETPSTAYPGDKGKANRDALNSMPTKLTSYLTPTTSTGELVKINYKYAAKDGLNYGPLQDDNIDIPSATTTNAGAMSAIDKGRLDDLYNEFGSIQNPGDKLDSLPNNLVTGLDATSRNATSVTINYKQSDLSAASNSYANPITKSQTIPAATQSAAGVMTATDKQNLDVNIPNRITNLDNRVTTEVDRLEELIESSSSEITNDLNVEIQARKDGDAQLQTNINNLQSTMNTELAKKVGKVTVTGSGNAVTTASISGDTLTLTKGATYNNYVHPAGSAPSKSSGFYKFSTDSTSHVASVTAVTKADITALGIPAQNTNTTYTFANGSAGNFTVTPSGGTAQTVSVGKPANAGNADTVGGISPSAFVKKAGDTMTGNLTVGNTTDYYCVVDMGGYYKIIAVPTTGGWNRGFSIDSPTAVLVRFGAYGAGQSLNWGYVGTSYDGNNAWQKWNSSGSTVTVPLTTAAITSSGKVSASGGFFKESDARLKTDIKPLDYTLDQICSIPTVSFIMNDQKQIGTIAQNLEELGFEDIVTEGDTLKSEVNNPEQFESFTKDSEEYVKVKKVEYEMLGVLAIEGVKMLKDEIEKLKAEIETLKNKQHE
ncbi:endo-N-acetylneuraminidase tail fiber protein [uncultured phage cr19_1]|uniref:Endo-N-acetylneuraminidase tail fiber protein n=1 Tax=uncultured phage cr19_1 TaxID=2986420 RepID=A0AA48WWI4_9CAUD|nr:endo-N-acetylneuraminidase tail fiber protein [uncultured phage cr19_1]